MLFLIVYMLMLQTKFQNEHTCNVWVAGIVKEQKKKKNNIKITTL